MAHTLHLPVPARTRRILKSVMATSPSRITTLAHPRPQAASAPLALWHLLSLDAPTVATLWLCFIARATHTALAPAFVVAMFLVVWILYALDRLLDTRNNPNPAALEHRHHFHRTHRHAFRTAIVLATLALPPLLIASHLPAKTLELYAALALALALWFLAVHLRPTRSLPKEIVTGLFFAAALWVPFASSKAIIPALLLAALCTLNCIYIHTWEHSTAAFAHPTTILTRRHLPQASLAIILIGLLRSTPISLAIACSAALLILLSELRHHIESTTLRAAADLALLTPLFFLALVH